MTRGHSKGGRGGERAVVTMRQAEGGEQQCTAMVFVKDGATSTKPKYEKKRYQPRQEKGVGQMRPVALEAACLLQKGC